MFHSLAQSLAELSAADARRAALGYVSEAFAEAAVCAALRELAARHGEEKAIAFVESLPDRLRQGEFSSPARQ